MAFFDRYVHIPLPIITKHELGLPFPYRKLPIKFGTNPSTIFLVIVVTYRHTHRDTQTNADINILPHFPGEKYAFYTRFHSDYGPVFPPQINLPLTPMGD